MNEAERLQKVAEMTMCKCSILTFALLLSALPSLAQIQLQSPQTARQALIEMFTSNNEEAFAKHLPDAVRKLLPQNAGQAFGPIIYSIASFGNRRFLRSEGVETFDEGPTLLIIKQSQEDKTEVAIESDGLVGENDEIEITVHVYHGGQEQWLSVIPRLIFALREERHVWRLIEVTVSARVPLTDPEYLRGLRQQQEEANESAAQMRINSIVAAEDGYAERHPDRGFICSLPTLFTPETNENAVDDNLDPPQVYYDPGLANSESNGYRFELTGCEGMPGSRYQITAVPIDADDGAKTFCADESGTLKFLTGGKTSACVSRGEVVNATSDSTIESNQ